MNLVREFRTALGWSRTKLASEIAMSESAIEKVETEIGENIARLLAKVATREGYPAFAQRFLAEAGERVTTDESVDLGGLSDDERALAEWVVQVSRNPDVRSGRKGLAIYLRALMQIDADQRASENKKAKASKLTPGKTRE